MNLDLRKHTMGGNIPSIVCQLLKTAVSALVILCVVIRISAQGTYSKIEASFNITNLTTDPFDYAVTDVRVRVLQPDNSTVSLPAFFDGGTTWRVRHMPVMAGTYAVSGVLLHGSPLAVSNLQPSSWIVAGPPTGAGFIQVDPFNPRRFITGNGKRFFPSGQDVAWDITEGQLAHNVTNIFWRMGAAHENWSRVWMDNWDGKNLDWPASGPTLPLGQLNLTVAQKWDAIVAAADQAGIYFQMTLQHHGQYSTTVDPQWAGNPYDLTNNFGSTNGFMLSPVEFFTNTTAIALTERKIRYSIARWGYSPSVMAWELFNEVEYTDAGQTGQWGIIGAWHDQMATFIRSQDPYQHLITTSDLLTEPIWADCDYYTHHDYPSDVINGLEDAPDISSTQPVKPDFGSECATNGVPHYGVDAPIWAGLMNGQSGNEEPWWWDSLDAENDYIYFRATSDFITLSGLGQNVLSKSAPQVTGGADGPLSFAPGGGWATATQDTFVVGDTTPDGIGSAPSYLQGNYHRSMTPDGYTFDVDYPQAGTFSVQVLQIAAAGAGLEILLDANLETHISFPTNNGGNSGAPTNFTASIPVSAGSHSIELYNPGLDWILLGNITLAPYAPVLAAYSLGNSNFSAAWVWNQTNVFNPNATAAVAGTVQVAGLNSGTYSGTWWDTFAGAPISNFTFTVASTNLPVTVNTPAILRSAALYVGTPPQASVVAPALTQALGTNSPVLTVPLAIANGRGLPLGYWLSVTNASPAVYGTINSSQPGGPAYFWKDYSAIGQDISTNFTALAPPKSAENEGIAGPINIGFAFPFFTNSYSQLYVSPNGFITFTPFQGDTSTNTSLPNVSAPLNSIAFFWEDLDFSGTGHVYTYTDAINGTFTLQFQNVLFKGTTSTVNCELVLKTTGEILAAYQSMAYSNQCTIGAQNSDGTQGIAVAFDQDYLQPDFAVLLTPTPWLRFDRNAGYVAGSEMNAVNLSFDAAAVPYGNYTATILVQTTDTNQPLFTLPVSLAFTPTVTPTVTITSPFNGAVFAAPADVIIVANATETNGTVSNVQFFTNGVSLGTVLTPPFGITASDLAAGTYALTAVATASGISVTSAVVSITVVTPPTVTITSPLSGAVFAAPADVIIAADAAGTNGTVTSVQFFNNGTSMGTVLTPPFNITAGDLEAGTYALTAVATASGISVTSAVVSITVVPPPTVTITNPLSGAVFAAPANVIIAANAAEGNSTVTSVQFFNNGTSLGTILTPPFNVTASNLAAGTYALTAVATASGISVTSAVVNITVVPPPTVTITSPFNGAVFAAPADVIVAANAAEANGTATSVQFFNNGTSLGTILTPPFNVTASNLAAGTYALTAVATASGIFVTSAVVSITVVTPPTVTITNPLSGAVFAAPADVIIAANATETNGTVSNVQFFTNGISLGTVLMPPFNLTASDLAAGTYALTAVATASGISVTSAVVSVTVVTPPTVTITNPVGGAVFAAPADVFIAVDAAVTNGTLTSVQFFTNDVSLGTVLTPPFGITASNLAAGTYALTAVATASGISVTSEVVNVLVVSPPTVTIISPPGGAVFAASADVFIAANATETNGTVGNVQFFTNGVSLGTVLTPPFGITASNLAAGAYALTAVATASGISSTSLVVYVSVVNPIPVNLSGATINSGQFTFSYTADAGLAYVIESSSNLVDWASLATNVASGSPAPFSDSLNSTGAKFYRVGLLPGP
jgi:hypothetical protein